MVHFAVVGAHVRETVPDIGAEIAEIQLQQVVEVVPELAGVEVASEAAWWRDFPEKDLIPLAPGEGACFLRAIPTWPIGPGTMFR